MDEVVTVDETQYTDATAMDKVVKEGEIQLTNIIATDEVVKVDETRLEEAKSRGIDLYGLRKSAFDQLPILRTVKIFRRAVLYCFLCYTMSMLDGWAVSLKAFVSLIRTQGGTASSIVINEGFVKQFGTRQGKGVLALSPTLCELNVMEGIILNDCTSISLGVHDGEWKNCDSHPSVDDGPSECWAICVYTYHTLVSLCLTVESTELRNVLQPCQ